MGCCYLWFNYGNTKIEIYENEVEKLMNAIVNAVVEQKPFDNPTQYMDSTYARSFQLVFDF